MTLATIVWRWIKQHKFNLDRITKRTSLKTGVLLCVGASKVDDRPWGIGVYVDSIHHSNLIKISQFQDRTNSFKTWWINAADPKCFDKLEHRIKKILR